MIAHSAGSRHFDITLSLKGVVLFYFLTFFFLLSQNAPGSYCIFPTPILESAIPAKRSDSFHQIMVLETKIWVLVCLFLLGCHCYRPSQLTHQGSRHVFTEVCIYTYLWIFVTNCILTKHEFILVSPNPVYYHMDYCSFLHLFVAPLLIVKKLVPTIKHLLNCSIPAPMYSGFMTVNL